MKDHNEKQDKSRNPDPITGAPGSHPIGTGLGAAAGGAATGAAVGTVAGPVGTAVGVAEKINPTAEDAYWRENHERQSYAKGRPYDDFQPAYQVGYQGFAEYGGSGRGFTEYEAELRRRYETNQPRLGWDEARPASEAAWRKFENPEDPGRSDESAARRQI
jgi:hypothetical protein